MSKQKIVHPDRDAGFMTRVYSDDIMGGGFLFISGQASVDFKISAVRSVLNEDICVEIGRIVKLPSAHGNQ